MRILFSILLGLALSSCASLSENKEAAGFHLKIGQGHLSAGNYPQALAELISAEKLDSSDPVIQNYLGVAFSKRDRLDLAEYHIRQALNIKGDYSEARNNLGQILIERGKYKEASIELQKVVNDLTYPFPDRALTNLGIAKFKALDFKGAKADLQKAIEIQKENCLALNYYGRCFYEMKDYVRSAEALDKAVGYCQRLQFDEPHYYSALSYFQLGKAAQAQSRLEALIKLYPDGKYLEKAKSALDTIKR